MVDILHRIGVTSSPDDVYAALTTIDGLAELVDGGHRGRQRHRRRDPVPLRAGPAGSTCRSWRPEPDELVLWEVVDGPEEWVGTHIRFELKQEDGFTIVLFQHIGWKEPVEFMHHCSTKWATFLMSLKKLVETGTGEPAPHDVQISNWH